MRIVIVGGGIAAVYIANTLMERDGTSEVVIVSDEEHPPYDRIHLCKLVEDCNCVDSIELELHPKVRLELNQKIDSIDTEQKRIFSENAAYHYDKLIIATGSRPKSLFDISGIENAATFRSQKDCEQIAQGMIGKNVVIVGAGPIALELLDTLMRSDAPKSITLLVRKSYLYSASISREGLALIQGIFEADPRVRIQFNDQITDKEIQGNRISKIVTKGGEIDDPFVIFGVGIDPNIPFARGTLECDRGILVDARMCTSDENIYCVGEAAQLREGGFVAGRVKECTIEADVAIANLFGEDRIFTEEVSIDGLKVGSFLFADVTATDFDPNDKENENILISHGDRIDQYIVNHDRLKRFIGINTNIDLLALKRLIETDSPIDAAYLYSNRLMSEYGKLICSCEGVHELELVDIIRENAVTSFADLKEFSKAGRTCGRCKQDRKSVV